MLTNKRWYLLLVLIIVFAVIGAVLVKRTHSVVTGTIKHDDADHSTALPDQQNQSGTNASNFRPTLDGSTATSENKTGITFDPTEIELQKNQSKTPLTIHALPGTEITFIENQVDVALTAGLLRHGNAIVAKNHQLVGGQAYTFGADQITIAVACAIACDRPLLAIQPVSEHQTASLIDVKIVLNPSGGQWSTRQKSLIVLAVLVVFVQVAYVIKALRRRRKVAPVVDTRQKPARSSTSSSDRFDPIPASRGTTPVTRVAERADGAVAGARGVTGNQPLEVRSGQTSYATDSGRNPTQAALTGKPAVSADDQMLEDLAADLEKLSAAIIEVVHKTDDALNGSVRAENGLALLTSSINDYQIAAQGEMRVLQEKVQQMTDRLAALEDTAQKQWPGLLAPVLQSNAEIGGRTAELELKLNEFFSKANADAEKLDSLAKTAGLVAKSISGLRAWIRDNCPNSQNEFAEIATQATDLCEEIAVVEENLRSHSLRLRFSCEVSAFPGARQTFFESLGSALAKEMAKWQDPASYLTRKLKEFARAAAYDCCDAADGRLDPERTNLQLQPLLLSLVRACGLEQIAPLRGDAYQPALHEVVQSVSARNSYPSQSVAQTTTRGFSQQDDVVRKARVIVFR